MAGKRKRPAIGGRGLVGWTVAILNSSPEASAGGRFFPLSAHGRRPTWWWTEGGWLGGVVGGRGHDPSPEPPLLFLPGLGLCFGGANAGTRARFPVCIGRVLPWAGRPVIPAVEPGSRRDLGRCFRGTGDPAVTMRGREALRYAPRIRNGQRSWTACDIHDKIMNNEDEPLFLG